jgi:hypothetical protein
MTHPLEKLLSLWKNATISIDQLGGYMLQNVILLEKRIEALEKATKHYQPPVEPVKKEEKL